MDEVYLHHLLVSMHIIFGCMVGSHSQLLPFYQINPHLSEMFVSDNKKTNLLLV